MKLPHQKAGTRLLLEMPSEVTSVPLHHPGELFVSTRPLSPCSEHRSQMLPIRALCSGE